MFIRTTRFGLVTIEPTDLLQFPTGLLGLEGCRQWVLLADAQNGTLGWLQSTTRPEVALAVVSPRRFVPDYQFRVFRSDLSALELTNVQDAQVLVVVNKNERGITLNLRAPIIVNISRRTARQVIANGDHPVQHELAPVSSTARTPLRMSA